MFRNAVSASSLISTPRRAPRTVRLDGSDSHHATAHHAMMHSVRVPIHTVDAFADKPSSGNPAAVCLLDRPAAAPWMQSVAREMNLSETAFVSPRAGGDGFDLRWFTPAVEVDLCGHATLASAHVLWEAG